MADQDFRNDRVDAGEVGAGHNVTALYEIKFHDSVELEQANDVALTVQIRYQDVGSGEVVEVAQPFAFSNFSTQFNQTSPEFRLIAAVAEYAEILRGSYWAQDSSLADVKLVALSAEPAFANHTDVSEFMQLLERAIQLTADERGS